MKQVQHSSLTLHCSPTVACNPGRCRHNTELLLNTESPDCKTGKDPCNLLIYQQVRRVGHCIFSSMQHPDSMNWKREGNLRYKQWPDSPTDLKVSILV